MSVSTLGDSARHVGVIRFKPLFTSYNSCIESFKQHYLNDFNKLGLEELPLFDAQGNMLFTSDKLSTLLHQTQAIIGFLKGLLHPDLYEKDNSIKIFQISSSGDVVAQASSFAENQIQISVDIFLKVINDLDFDPDSKREIIQELNEIKNSREPSASNLSQLAKKISDKFIESGADKLNEFIFKLLVTYMGLS